MGKAATPRRRTTTKNSDPALDYLAMFDARSMMLTEIASMGWKLACMVLIPIFVGVQLDKRFDSSPSLTLAAFFIAIFGASMLIYRTYNELTARAAIIGTKKTRKKTVKRVKDV